MTAMEAPNSFSADAIRTEKEKAKAIDAIRPLMPQEVAMNAVRGQYKAGIATLRLPHRRSHPVPASRQHRGRVGGGSADPRRLGGRT
jgi:hypothetical protein